MNVHHISLQSSLSWSQEGGYEGKLTPEHGTIWRLTAMDVIAHFEECGGRRFLRSLPTTFEHVPVAGRAKAAPAKRPNF